MKRIFILSVFTLLFCISSFAQNKIVVIDSNAFYNEKSGIKILINAVIATYDCDFQSSSFIKKIGELKNEIENLKVNSKSTDEKVSELSKIEEEYNSYRKRRAESYKKRYSVLVEPIEKKIKDKLKLFINEKGFTQIIDLSDDRVVDAVLYIDSSIDVTNEFIKFCNEEFEKEKTQKQ